MKQKEIEEEIKRFKYNEKIRDIIIMIIALIIIFSIIGIIGWSILN